MTEKTSPLNIDRAQLRAVEGVLHDAACKAAEVLAAYGRTMAAQLEAARPAVAAYDAELKRQGRVFLALGDQRRNLP